MSYIITGNGSAAKRHVSALNAFEGHNYAIIASLTTQHQEDVLSLVKSGFKGKCVVEKPMMVSTKPDFPIYVGYQLRFHPKIQELKQRINGLNIKAVSIYAGQAIDLWKGSYHKSAANGGGVLNDYSHELDLVQYVFGKIKNAKGKLGYVKGIESEATATITCATEHCSKVIMYLNYLSNPPRREMLITTTKGDIFANYRELPDNLTELMHEDILNDGGIACTFDEGLRVDNIIREIKTSNLELQLKSTGADNHQQNTNQQLKKAKI